MNIKERKMYSKCFDCNEIMEENEVQHRYIRGHRDSTGFQYEPDEHSYYCPHCGSDEIIDMEDDDWLEVFKELKGELNDNENTIRNQRLKIKMMEDEDHKCTAIKNLEDTVKMLKEKLHDALYPAVKELREA